MKNFEVSINSYHDESNNQGCHSTHGIGEFTRLEDAKQFAWTQSQEMIPDDEDMYCEVEVWSIVDGEADECLAGFPLVNLPVIQEGSVVVEIPHRMRAEMYEIVEDTPRFQIAYDWHDLHAVHVFDSMDEAKEWARGYKGHQWVLVQRLLNV